MPQFYAYDIVNVQMEKESFRLPICGIPLIERVCRQLQPGFSHILISASLSDKYDFLGFPVVLDEKPDIGPMMAVPADGQPWLKNLNTLDDYRHLLQGNFGKNRSMESHNG